MSQDIIFTNKDQIVPKHENRHNPYEYFKYEITKRDINNQCYICFYDIPPKKTAYPYHYHMANTEVFYIISGHGLFITPEGEREVSSGDIIVLGRGPNGAHKIVNTSETEVLTYLDCDTAVSPDVVFYPD